MVVRGIVVGLMALVLGGWHPVCAEPREGVVVLGGTGGPGLDIMLRADGLRAFSNVGDGIVSLSRDAATGLLTQGGTVLQPNPNISGHGPGAALSPDGKSIYATGSDSLFHYQATAEGGVSYVTRIIDGEGGVDGLDDAIGAVVSPDGAHVYVQGAGEDAIAIFARSPLSGVLAYVGIVQDGVGGVDGIANPQQVVLSPDGRHLYAASDQDDAVAFFERDVGTGLLTYLGQVTTALGFPLKASSVAVSPDGLFVYVAAGGATGVAAFSRNPMSGLLTAVQVTGVGASRLFVSPDGMRLHDRGTRTFARNPVTGEVTFSDASFDGTGTYAMSPDGEFFYGQGDGASTHVYKRFHSDCTTTAMVGCLAAKPNGSRASVKGLPFGAPSDAKGTLRWKWVPPVAVPLSVYGNPATTTDTVMCIYDDTTLIEQPLNPAAEDDGELQLASGWVCRGKPCWKATGSGFAYRNRDGFPDGIKRATFKTTGVKIQVSGEEFSTIAGDIPFAIHGFLGQGALPIRFQLQNSDGTCIESVFTTATTNAGHVFRARGN